MELEELRRRLGPFCRSMYGDDGATVGDVWMMPGHAGFSYGFDVTSRGAAESWFLRLPPPNVNWRGTADVLRQVAALNALAGSQVPHCSVKWSGDDLQWFDRPYFVGEAESWLGALALGARMSPGRTGLTSRNMSIRSRSGPERHRRYICTARGVHAHRLRGWPR